MGPPYTPECRWVDLYLNGEYAGLYLLTEVRDAILALAGKTAPAQGGAGDAVAAMQAQALATPGPDAPEGTLPPDTGASPAEVGRA